MEENFLISQEKWHKNILKDIKILENCYKSRRWLLNWLSTCISLLKKIIAVDLIKQQALDVDWKIIQQISFIKYTNPTILFLRICFGFCAAKSDSIVDLFWFNIIKK